MVDRIRNVIKQDRKKSGTVVSEVPVESKRKAKEQEILRRYPQIGGLSSDTVDQETLQQHKKGIANELTKRKPRDSVLLPLMMSTYPERRMFVLNEAASVSSIIENFPAFKR